MKKILSLLLATALCLALCAVFAVADDPTPVNLAEGKTYTVTGKAFTTGYEDTNGDLLTDGVAEPSSWAWNSSTGYVNVNWPDGTTKITIDLGDTYVINSVKVHGVKFANTVNLFGLSDTDTVEYSVDGETYSDAVQATLDVDASTVVNESAYSSTVPYATAVEARYIRVTIGVQGTAGSISMTFLTEIEVYGVEAGSVESSSEEESSEESSEASLEESSEGTSEYVPTGKLVNFASGKSYTVTGKDISGAGAYGDPTGKWLTNRAVNPAAYGWAGSNDGYIGWNWGAQDIVIDLGEARMVEEVKVWGVRWAETPRLFGDGDNEHASEDEDYIQYSLDGETYSDLIEATINVDPDSVANETAYSASVTYTTPVEARYIKVHAGYNINYMYLSEIEVIGHAEEGDAPYGTGEFGDSGITALAIIVGLAAAGVVVVKKSR